MIAAVIPAAGESRRMGRPKLLLPIEGVAVLARVILAVRDGGAATIVVVAPPASAPESAAIVTIAETSGARVVVPTDQPPDMRASVELGLAELASLPEPPTTVLLTPADSPGLTAATVARVIAAAREHPGRVVIPWRGERRGHPVALPWLVAQEVRNLPKGVGVNALAALNDGSALRIELDDPGILVDLDTPEDYRRWTGTEP